MTPADIEALARRAGVKLEDGAPLWSEVAAMLALARREALEEAEQVCKAQNDTDWPTPLGCAAAPSAEGK